MNTRYLNTLITYFESMVNVDYVLIAGLVGVLIIILGGFK